MSLNIPVNIIFVFLLLVVFIERLIECFLDIKDLFIKTKITDPDKRNEKSRRILATCWLCKKLAGLKKSRNKKSIKAKNF
ncbi:MAG: hypothetical protein ABRQ39_10285 [Candidatus Eremiobacterota bacterium]